MMHSRYNAKKAKAIRAKAQTMARARWSKDRALRDAEAPARERELAIIKAENLPRRQGEPVGILQYSDLATGRVRRWTLRIGDRRDRFTVTLHEDGRRSASHGLTFIFNRLRTKILRF